MRIGKVIGRILLTQPYETLVGGRFLLVEVQDRFSLTGKPRKGAKAKNTTKTEQTPREMRRSG